MGGRIGSVRKCSDSAYILKIELTPYVGGLDVENDEKQRNQKWLKAFESEQKK